ncbi:MAG: hypothetical protein MUF51_10455, partial [Vicinamibacteria bacterium]|nr:hypothetical protein [Vicinamibacteria bacterium]
MNVRDFLRRTSAELAIVLFFVFWAVVITRPLAFHLTTHTIQGPDPPSHLYMLDRLSAQLTDPVHLFEGNIYFPARHTLLFTDLSMGTVVLVWPLRLIVHDATTLFNLGTILAFAFGGYAFHALTRSLTGSRAAGLLAGGLAAFNSHQATHVPHLNLITTGWMALALLGFHRLLTRPSPWSIVLTGVSCALTIQSSGYYAVALAVCAIVFVIYHWRAIWISRSNPQRGWVLFAFGAAFLVTVLLCSLYLRAFLELRAEEWLRRPSGVSAQMSFKPGRDLTSVSYLWGSWLGRGGERLFPGAVCLLLSVMAIWRR